MPVSALTRMSLKNRLIVDFATIAVAGHAERARWTRVRQMLPASTVVPLRGAAHVCLSD